MQYLKKTLKEFFFLTVAFHSGIALATVVPQRPVKAPKYAVKDLANYEELKLEVQNRIGEAKRNVILITDFLTDGDISSSLYLAQYRKLKVLVYLGRARLNMYLSRLKFLRSQGIRVLVRPELENFSEPTILIIDNKVYRIDRDLDTLKPRLKSQILLASPQYTANLFKALSNAPKDANIRVRPYQNVGKARYRHRSRGTGSAEGYNYDRFRPQGRPEDIARELPKVPVFQQNEQIRVQAEQDRSKSSSSEKNDDIEFQPTPDNDEKTIKELE